MKHVSQDYRNQKGFGAIVVVLGIGVVVLGGLLTGQYLKNSREESNKQLVEKFEELAFDKKDAAAAAEYLADNLVQHNPQIPDGKQGFIQGVGGYLLKQNPNLKIVRKRIVAKGDLVFVHKFGKFDNNNPAERGVAIIDIFRVEDSKIVEHWDVIQPIPETAANKNTLF